MGLFDAMAGALGGQEGAAGGGLLGAVIGMLGHEQAGGGLAGLVQKFQQGGLGDVVASWIGTGQNLPVSPDQLRQVLGSDVIGQLAQQLGVPQEDVASQLSQLLPQVVDQATPEGRLPDEGGLGSLGDVSALLGKLAPR